MVYNKNFDERQKVIVVFGTIMEATIIGKGSFSKFYPDHDGRYKVKYSDGRTGDPSEHLIYASREEYYKERIKDCEETITECKKRIKEASLVSSLP